MSQQYNLIHASESAEAAAKEEKLMFQTDEIYDWDKKDYEHIYVAEERKK
jgi:hypothetical protein